jgi:hypothetical protein
MLDDDRNGFVTIPEIIRIYLTLPKSCEFAKELRYILRYYMDNYMKFASILKKLAKFDIFDFHKIIPKSCILDELHDRFIDRVSNMVILCDK